MSETVEKSKAKIVISSCLLGNNVRFNGANSHKKLITEELASIFSYQAVCPEMTAGFGVPRDPIRLEKQQNEHVLVKKNDHITEVTTQLKNGVKQTIQNIADVDGFILKKSSPSCGLGSVKLYNMKGNLLHSKANGLFADAVQKQFGLIPMEDEGRLNDPYLKEHFVKCVLLTKEAKENVLPAKKIKDLVAFQTRHKFLLRLHHPNYQKALGRLIATAHNKDFELVKKNYYEMFLMAFKKVARQGNHHTVLQRMLREINRLISKSERAHLQRQINQYYNGILPLAVPVEVIKNYLHRYDIKFLDQQSYLTLYPESLGLMSKM